MIGFNFTERVRNVLAMARHEALRLRHEYVGTEHLLLALVREGDGPAMTVLWNLKANPDEIRQSVDKILLAGRSTAAGHLDLPYTSRAKKVLELAIAEANDLKHLAVGTEHLLFGLVREDHGIAAQVLKAAGLTEESVRSEIIRLLGGTPLESRSSAAHASMPSAFQLSMQPIVAFVATADADAALRFYRDVLKLPLVSEELPFALVFDAKGTTLRVTIVERVIPAGYTVLGWKVADIRIAAKTLEAAGIVFQRYEGMKQDEAGVWQSPSGAKIAWFKDPDGNTLSISE